MPRFFGLTSKHRIYIFSEIHEIVFHGKGGYDHNTVYNMPIWLRKFTLRQIVEFYDKEKRSYEKTSNNDKSKTVIDSEGNVKLPEFLKNPARKSRYNVEGRTSKE